MKLLLAITFAVVMSGCGASGEPPKYAREQNADRKTRLLPIIEESWANINNFNNRTLATWNAKYYPDSGKPGHSGKKVFYKSGNLEEEEDYYYSGKTFKSRDPDGGTDWESVTIRYSYLRPQSPWTCIYNSKDSADEISLDAAEALLRKWGLQRLNYKQ